jgi:ATP phosphoribosyltransferase regulatory subunit
MQWLLPAGIEDTLPPGVRRLESARAVVLRLFDSWGFDHVIPPLAEFQDSLLTGVGGDLADQTFRLMDPQSGKVLGIRADMTPQSARIAARHFDLSRPVRLCYLGSTLQARPVSFHRSRNPLQVGAELFGKSGSAGDVEIVRLMVATLQSLGVTDFVLAMGHVGIFHALADMAGLTVDQQTLYFDILQRKALTEIDAFLAPISMPSEYRTALRNLVDQHGTEEVLAQAQALYATANDAAKLALEELVDITTQLKAHLPDLPLYFDLAETRGYQYHTGLVFAAYVGGEGLAIASGGRYDGVAKVFGTGTAATGFSADLKNLVELSLTPETDDLPLVLAPGHADQQLTEKIATLRSEGYRVVYELPQAQEPLGVVARLVLVDKVWQLQS